MARTSSVTAWAWRPDHPGSTPTVFDEVLQPATGTLGQLDTRALGSGVFWIEVVSYDLAGQLIAGCAIRLRFE
ncbi:MAG: hypothetical protein HC915_05215 [Anaerolineae bacterium]|nr:hypothetical protein [Anaerolineae bacterium]